MVLGGNTPNLPFADDAGTPCSYFNKMIAIYNTWRVYAYKIKVWFTPIET